MPILLFSDRSLILHEISKINGKTNGKTVENILFFKILLLIVNFYKFKIIYKYDMDLL